MGSQEKPGLCDGIGKGQWLAWVLLNRPGFPSLPAGEGRWRPPRKNAHLNGINSRAPLDLRQELTLPTAIN